MIKFKSASGLLGADDGEQVEELQLRELVPFAEHPFQVSDQEKSFLDLKASIQRTGVAVPILVRPKGRGLFEIVSGHRRVKACQLLELTTIPGFIRDLDDVQATLHMVDTNIHRETLLHSEKAFAYRMKLEALKDLASRENPEPSGHPSAHPSAHPPTSQYTGILPPEALVPVFPPECLVVDVPPSSDTDVVLRKKSKEKPLKSRERLAQNTPDSSVQIQRYIRLTYLSGDLLDLVDHKKMAFQTGVELSYLREQEQEWLFECIFQGSKPSLQQAKALKQASQFGGLTREEMEEILHPETKPLRLALKSDMGQFFPPDTSPQEMEQVILDLLTLWKSKGS